MTASVTSLKTNEVIHDGIGPVEIVRERARLCSCGASCRLPAHAAQERAATSPSSSRLRVTD